MGYVDWQLLSIANRYEALVSSWKSIPSEFSSEFSKLPSEKRQDRVN